MDIGFAPDSADGELGRSGPGCLQYVWQGCQHGSQIDWLTRNR